MPLCRGYRGVLGSHVSPHPCLSVRILTSPLSKQANESETRKATNQVSVQDHNMRVDSTKRKSQRTVKTIWADHDAILERCSDLETRLGIHRWTENSPEYHAARTYANNRKYQLLLDKVEGLVAQRLMEMQKCNIRGTSEYCKPAFRTISHHGLRLQDSYGHFQVAEGTESRHQASCYRLQYAR